MGTTRARRLGAMLVTLVALMATVSMARAQGGAIITGTVTNPEGVPVEAASVGISALNVGAITTTDGHFTIQVNEANANGQNVSISVRRIGFSPATQQVALTAGEHTVNFTLTADVRRLEEMVVTGVAKATSMKNTTISIAKLSKDQLDKVPATNVVSALAGKVAGAKVLQTTGVPGAGASIRLRGSTSLQVGNNDPLFLVDGVISKNGLDDIDPQDIVSIEVLKGAASANTYGSEAANGVIAVSTNRGKDLAEGELSILFRSEIGRTSLEHFVPLQRHHAFELNSDGTIATDAGGKRIPTASGYAENPYPSAGPERWRNQLETWLQSNTTYNNYVSLGYRKDNTNFYGSLSRSKDAGIMPMLDGFQRQNVRLNLDQALADKLDFSGSFLYAQDQNDQSGAVRGTGTFFALLQAPPDIDLEHPPGDTARFGPKLPFSNDRGNPLYGLAHQQFERNTKRLFGSFTARYRPTNWLSLDASYGTDHYDRLETNYQARGYLNTSGTPGTGFLEYRSDQDVSSNSQVNATLTYGLADLSATTRLTYLYESEHDDFFRVNGGKLNIGGTPALDALDPKQLFTESSQFTIRSHDYFVTQDFNYGDRYLAQAVFRRDGSSLFGADARWQNFYGLSGAWRISEDFNIPGIQELKVRAAVGTAGLRPRFEAQYETYDLENGSISKGNLGNVDLRPAIQRETEVGVNVSFLDRFDVEFVKSDRTTKDAFLNVPLSLPLNGGFGNQWQNIAQIGARTFELALTTRVVQGADFGYSFTFTADRTRQMIDKLGVPPFQVGNGSQGQNIFYYRPGEALGVVYGKRWATDVGQLLDNPANAGMSLQDLQAIYSVNSDGFVVLTDAMGTDLERAVAYVDANGSTNVRIANSNSDFNFGWANTIRFKRFTFYALVDGTRGGDLYNFTKQWMFQDGRAGDLDQFGKPDDEKKNQAYYSGFYNNLEPNSYFVEDGSYVKLRELSVSYTFSPELLDRLGGGGLVHSLRVALIGRNLKTWTNYSGFDPEAASASDLNLRIDGFRYPTFRQISGQIQIGF